MQLDLRTVIVSSVASAVICSLVVVALWRQGRNRYAGTGYWAVGFAMQTAGLFLVTLRGQVPNWLSMVVANTIIISSAVMVHYGLGRFFERKCRKLFNTVLVLTFFCVHVYFTMVEPDLAIRNLNISAALLIVILQNLWLMGGSFDRSMRKSSTLLALVFGAYGLLSLARILSFFAVKPTQQDLFDPDPFEATVLLTYQALFVLHTFGLVLMVNHRLVTDVRGQEARFSAAFRSAPFAVMLTRLTDGLVTDVNDGFADITGHSPAEIVGVTTVAARLWVRPEDRAEVVAELERSGKVHAKEFPFRVKSGDVITGLLSAQMLRVGGQVYILSTINDITESRQRELQRQQSDGVERQRQKLEAIGTLASGVAHEINNPLTVILNYGDLLQTEVNPVHVKDYASNIVRESERVATIVRNLLSFARQDSDVSTAANLADVVDRTLSLARSGLRKEQIAVECSVPADLPAVTCRPQQIQQVLMNLLTNARDAMREVPRTDGSTGALHIVGATFDKDGTPWVRITVQDNGTGILPDVAPKVFDPFFSTKARDKGTGLGLSISYGIVRDHRGELWFETEVGKGTSFHLDLPVQDDSRSEKPA
jgi:PAS domain S-box-containing protein